MIPKTPSNVRTAYGLALEDAGLQGAIQNIGTLLDDGYQEKFIEYYPSANAFNVFMERFTITRFAIMKKFEWEYDEEILARDPGHRQTIRDYYESVFKPAVMNLAGGGTG